MTHALTTLGHRGPDATGSVQLSHCALGHQRLAIIDLSAAGEQPMANDLGSLWIVFNGEIYNYAELRNQLRSTGHRFRSASDTEVLLHLYEESGSRMLQRVRGMFAFAIWNEKEQLLFLARDHLGIKPLYYRTFGSALDFASEVRTFVGDNSKVSAQGLASYLRLGWVQGPDTILAGVHELPPGHLLEWRSGSTRVERWWAMRPRRTTSLTSVGTALEQSAARHVIADVPVGLFMSAGVDSVAIAAALRRLDLRTRAFTVRLVGDKDESGAAAEIAALLGIDHEVVTFDAKQVVENVDRLVSAIDQPTIDGVNTWAISSAVRSSGIKVALSGLGGDELFRGYRTFVQMRQLAAYVKSTAWLRSSWRALPVRGLAGIRERGVGRLGRGAEAIEQGDTGAIYLAVRGMLPRRSCNRLAPSVFDGDETSDIVARQSHPGLPEDLSLELSNYLPYQLLRQTDFMSMAHSLEVRVPLLDRDFVEEAAGVPETGFVGLQGKAILAATIHDDRVKALVNRPKQGFALPIGRWIQGELKDWTQESLRLLLETGLVEAREVGQLWTAFCLRRISWDAIWGLAVLGRWLAIYIPVPDVVVG